MARVGGFSELRHGIVFNVPIFHVHVVRGRGDFPNDGMEPFTGTDFSMAWGRDNLPRDGMRILLTMFRVLSTSRTLLTM